MDNSLFDGIEDASIRAVLEHVLPDETSGLYVSASQDGSSPFGKFYAVAPGRLVIGEFQMRGHQQGATVKYASVSCAMVRRVTVSEELAVDDGKVGPIGRPPEPKVRVEFTETPFEFSEIPFEFNDSGDWNVVTLPISGLDYGISEKSAAYARKFAVALSAELGRG